MFGSLFQEMSPVKMEEVDFHTVKKSSATPAMQLKKISYNVSHLWRLF